MRNDPLDLYSAIALDHARRPRHLGVLSAFGGCARITGPCGDTMVYWLLIRDHLVLDVAWVTSGCASSRAAGSMAASLIAGRTLAEVEALDQQAVLDGLGRFPQESAHCALLAANTIGAALANARERGLDAPLLHTMRVAVPLDGERLAEHFGRSQRVSIIEVEPLMRVLGGRGDHEVPPEPGALPRWLAEQRVDLVIAASIGAGAEAELARLGIELISGAPRQSPEDLVGAWMDGLLPSGHNACDH